MLAKAGIGIIAVLVVGASGLVAAATQGGLAMFSGQASNTGNTFTTANFGDSTGLLDPSAQAADTGGDNDGFEQNPTYAFADDALKATNTDGPGDRHRYYNYGISIPGGSTIDGIRVRLDWWMAGAGGTNSMSVELSWDGGTSWTAPKTDTNETSSEHTAFLGGAAETWGRAWTVDELSNANFRVRLTCNCSGSAECESRDYYLDWVAVDVYYTPP